MHDQQSQWSKWIKVAQFVWNNMVSSVTTDSPFGITRSYPPRMGMEPLDTKVLAIKDFATLFRKVTTASEESMTLQANKQTPHSKLYSRPAGRVVNRPSSE